MTTCWACTTCDGVLLLWFQLVWRSLDWGVSGNQRRVDTGRTLTAWSGSERLEETPSQGCPFTRAAFQGVATCGGNT